MLEAHSTPSESVRKCLLSVYFGYNIFPPLVQGRQGRLLGTHYGSLEQDLGLPLVKDTNKGFQSSLHSPSLFILQTG